MTENEIYAFLAETFLVLFNRDDIKITPELKAMDVEGWDSFVQINIIIETEENFGIRFTSEDLNGLRNIGDFVVVVLSKVAGKSGN